MINLFRFHVFYEDQDYGGFYIGSYLDEDSAKKMGDYLWELFDNRFKQEAIEEFNTILESSRKYPIMKEKEYLLRAIWLASTGMNSTRIFRKRDDGFVEKYIRFMGEGQAELFTEL
jgi:hypothetical protein